MSKLLVFGIMIVVGIVVNLSVLYAIVLGLRADVAALTEQVSKLSTLKPDASGTVADQPDTVASSAAENTCPNCRAEIDSIKQILLRITPSAGAAFTSIPSNTVPVQAKEFFVPLGNGKTKANEWEDIAGMVATIDSRNYSGVKAVYFEVSLRIPTANGTVSARLFNKTDGHPVWNSEVSSEGDKAQLKTARGLVLDSGEKVYQVQMKNTLQSESIADIARLKIVLQ